MAYTLPAVSYGNGKINGTRECETELPNTVRTAADILTPRIERMR